MKIEKIVGIILLAYPLGILGTMTHFDWEPYSGFAAYLAGCISAVMGGLILVREKL